MKETFAHFSSIIQDFKIRKTETGNKTIITSEIVFIDNSILNIYIADNKTKQKHKYSFHWQTIDNQMIIRWDNAPHHPEISTFPHHKHIADNDNIKPSSENTLHEVLTYITQNLIT